MQIEAVIFTNVITFESLLCIDAIYYRVTISINLKILMFIHYLSLVQWEVKWTDNMVAEPARRKKVSSFVLFGWQKVGRRLCWAVTVLEHRLAELRQNTRAVKTAQGCWSLVQPLTCKHVMPWSVISGLPSFTGPDVHLWVDRELICWFMKHIKHRWL